MRIYISVDIEGICNVVNTESTGKSGYHYVQARKQMTAETNAAIMGALAVGAKEIIVNDSHGGMTNLIPEDLHPAASLIQGTPKPFMMMEGIDADFDAALFIGYHARMQQHGVLSHTISGGVVSNIYLNDQPVGETAINAGIAGYYNVPVVFISGDQEVAREAKTALTNIKTAIVKEAITRYSARSLHPSRAYDLIEAGVKEALSDLKQYNPHRPAAPYTFALQFIQAGQADAAAMMPGTERIDASTVGFTHPDYIEAFRGLRCMISLARA